ncbi:4-hydroxy-3-methylbut-2-enyl diphosphate reductase [Candidatus Shapirobacteria bacterium]|nr:4-hydroxy-3-methylbut-2-enyl diphosphate reductase [Candidatus Shapirobacteria bacterium]
MEIIFSKRMGFCPGVKRAWGLVGKTLQKKDGPIYILGELIHNQEAMDKLNQWGIKTIDDLNGVKKGKGTVIIRAHGEPPKTYQKLKDLKLKFVDTTCNNVIKIQNFAKQLSVEGFFVIICGKKDHPEPKAILGHVQKGLIVDSINDAKRIPRMKKIAILSQTTFSPENFRQICQILKKKTKDFKSIETFCQMTHLAQKEAQKVAKKVELMIVIGGKGSSNTQRLAETCRRLTTTYHVENDEELKKYWFEKIKQVGITAGASTPDWVIEKVKNKIKSFSC